MLRINQIKIPVQQRESDALEKKIKKILRTNQTFDYRIVKKSVDARDRNHLLYIYTVDVWNLNEKHIKVDNKNIMSTKEGKYQFPCQNNKTNFIRPVIIGAGPAGYFAALYLSRAGFRPIVFERGKAVEERTKDVTGFWNGSPIQKNSNVSFGEGGAGTFSDGKLNTGIKDKMGRIQAVVSDFVQFGAPEEIAYLNKPHIGTDELKHVLVRMREEIIRYGGEIHFSSQLVDINHGKDGLTLTIRHLDSEIKEKIETSACILAIGHSARDTFAMLQDEKIPMEAKAFAMGLRIEHLQEMINKSQYGDSDAAKLLPAADYKMTFRSSTGRSVYSFCMCPGGFVVNASSDEEQCVVNGMSNHNRDEANANAAVVVNVTPEDFEAEGYGAFGPLAGVAFQKKYEKLSYEEGKGKIPVQLFEDFRKNQTSTKIGTVAPNIKGDYTFGNLNNCLPPYVNNAIIEAIEAHDKKLKGFASKDAVLSGIESRTSSPVRITRDDSLQSAYRGLFPCGEGAGYAGGITSAAVDGIKVAEAVAAYIMKNEDR